MALELKILIFRQNFAIRQFEGVDFKYDNSFLKVHPKNIQIRHFWH